MSAVPSMAAIISSLGAIYFILVQGILLNVVRSEFSVSHDAVNHTSSWKSGRMKRSLYDELPQTLEIEIKYATEERINLIWIKTHKYLANEHLSVITTFTNSLPNVMENVGEFVMYHDLKESSAVVYFAKSNRLYGVIGLDYYIRGLPFDFDAHGKYILGVVGEPFVDKRLRPIVSFPPVFVHPPFDNKRPSDDNPGPSTKHQRTKRNFDGRVHNNGTITNENEVSLVRKRRENTRIKEYYLETLVFVTNDIAKLFKLHYGEGKYIEWIVRNHIIYFNAVDMIFQKMQNCRIKFVINIAKIVIEDELMPLPFTTSNDEFQFSEVTAKLPLYLYIQRFEPGSFDYVFIHTSRTIIEDFTMIGGLTKYGADLYEARRNNQFYEAVPITVVGFKYVYANYMVAVQEISRILNMRIESQEDRLEPKRQRHGIIQNGDNALKWSDDNRHLFRVFFSENRNRCFLLNKPRSLRPPGTFKDLTPNQQCQCFGYHSYIRFASGKIKDRLPSYLCNEPLECENFEGNEKYFEFTVRPFDGTSCSHTKVCWNGECVNISSS